VRPRRPSQRGGHRHVSPCIALCRLVSPCIALYRLPCCLCCLVSHCVASQ
jgi:hypothetical protein